MACRPIDPSLIGDSLESAAPSTLDGNLKKLIGCWTGQCGLQGGSCAFMKEGSYGEAECKLFDGAQVQSTGRGRKWNTSTYCGCLSAHSGSSWHIWNYGLSMGHFETG